MDPLATDRAGPLLSRREALRIGLVAPVAGVLFGSTCITSRAPATAVAVGRRGLRAGSDPRPHVVVVGAGAFGGWTALHLLRRKARVTLLDAWGAGNSRASSGGETRVIRVIYGGRRVYVDMARRAVEIWRESERRWNRKVYHRTGSLWMFQADDAYARSSLPLLREAGLAAAQISLTEARRRYPQIDFGGIRTVFYEAEAGYLTARAACELVRESVVAEGGEYRTALTRPGPISAGAMASVGLGDGGRIEADRFVFACGPWLGKLFPDVVGGHVTPSRQEVFFFGPPAGDERFAEGVLPVWLDFGERLFYGIPGNERRGFKIADDTHGEPVDPTTLERVPSAEALSRARQTLAGRFPALADAPLLETRVCQYENSPDGDFIVDRHPQAENVWLVGGGSGHGFKMGPALGEHVARLVLDEARPEPAFLLERFRRREGGRQRSAAEREEGAGS